MALGVFGAWGLEVLVLRVEVRSSAQDAARPTCQTRMRTATRGQRRICPRSGAITGQKQEKELLQFLVGGSDCSELAYQQARQDSNMTAVPAALQSHPSRNRNLGCQVQRSKRRHMEPPKQMHASSTSQRKKRRDIIDDAIMECSVVSLRSDFSCSFSHAIQRTMRPAVPICPSFCVFCHFLGLAQKLVVEKARAR